MIVVFFSEYYKNRTILNDLPSDSQLLNDLILVKRNVKIPTLFSIVCMLISKMLYFEPVECRFNRNANAKWEKKATKKNRLPLYWFVLSFNEMQLFCSVFASYNNICLIYVTYLHVYLTCDQFQSALKSLRSEKSADCQLKLKSYLKVPILNERDLFLQHSLQPTHISIYKHSLTHSHTQIMVWRLQSHISAACEHKIIIE